MGSGGTSAPGVTSRGYTGCSSCGCGCSGGMSTSESYSPGGRRHYTPAGVYGGGTLAEGTGEFETSSRRVFSRYIDAGCGQLRDRSRYDTRTGAAPVTAAGALQYSEAKEDAGTSGGGRKRIVSARKLQEMKRVHGYTFQ